MFGCLSGNYALGNMVYSLLITFTIRTIEKLDTTSLYEMNLIGYCVVLS